MSLRVLEDEREIRYISNASSATHLLDLSAVTWARPNSTLVDPCCRLWRGRDACAKDPLRHGPNESAYGMATPLDTIS